MKVYGWRRWSVAVLAIISIFVVELVAQELNTAGVSTNAQVALLGVCASYFGFDGLSKRANGKKGKEQDA